ncbi:hypothetical protein HK096_005085 [Nowakowskiella sp. JEL0078]|nr:hypothetical protein HK096_005085 [Nowakowskiella sp. JEL0078]
MISVQQADFTIDKNLNRKNLMVDNESFVKELKTTHFALGEYHQKGKLSQYESSYQNKSLEDNPENRHYATVSDPLTIERKWKHIPFNEAKANKMISTQQSDFTHFNNWGKFAKNHFSGCIMQRVPLLTEVLKDKIPENVNPSTTATIGIKSLDLSTSVDLGNDTLDKKSVTRTDFRPPISQGSALPARSLSYLANRVKYNPIESDDTDVNNLDKNLEQISSTKQILLNRQEQELRKGPGKIYDSNTNDRKSQMKSIAKIDFQSPNEYGNEDNENIFQQRAVKPLNSEGAPTLESLENANLVLNAGSGYVGFKDPLDRTLKSPSKRVEKIYCKNNTHNFSIRISDPKDTFITVSKSTYGNFASKPDNPIILKPMGTGDFPNNMPIILPSTICKLKTVAETIHGDLKNYDLATYSSVTQRAHVPPEIMKHMQRTDVVIPADLGVDIGRFSSKFQQ